MPDFVKRKAKVGKRAPKKLNDTDTSFRAASLHVADQKASVAQDTARPVPVLLSQLHHPAEAVRLAAAKSLKDRFKNDYNSSPRDWIQSVAQCSVDEESSVRQVGIESLQRGITQVNLENVKPFLNIIVTFLSGALNSLDKSTRNDAANSIGVLSRSVPMKPFVVKLLPPFTRIVQEYRIIRAGGGNSKAKKRKRNESNRTPNILEALLSLLENVEEDEPVNYSNDNEMVSETTRLTLLPPQGRPRYLAPIHSLEELTQRISEASKQPSPNSETQALVNKLRDKFVEVTQRGHRAGDLWRLSWEDLESARVIVRCAQLLVSNSTLSVVIARPYKWMPLWMENFPFFDDKMPQSKATELNTEVCIMLTNFYMTAGASKDEYKKLKKAVSLFIRGQMDGTDNLSVPIVQVLKKLVSENKELAGMFVDVLFGSTPILRARSEAHRLGVMVVVEKLLANILILKRLPDYLLSWKGDFPQESKEVLRYLLASVLLVEEEQEVNALKKSVSRLVTPLDDRPSLITQLQSTQLQQQIICLLVKNGSISNETMQCLADLCCVAFWTEGDHRIGYDIAAFTVASIHAIRKKLRMQVYFSFLMDSLGFCASVDDGIGEMEETERLARISQIFQLDRPISIVASCLVDCSTYKVLPMVERVFISMMEVNPLAGTRAVAAFLAFFALDLKLRKLALPVVTFLKVLTSETLASNVLNALEFQSRCPGMAQAEEWSHPLLALLRCEPVVMSAVLQQVEARLQSCDLTKQIRLGKALITVVEDDVLCDLIARDYDSLRILKRLQDATLEGEVNKLVERAVTPFLSTSIFKEV